MPGNEYLLLFSYKYWLLQTCAMMLTALLIPRLTVTGPFGACVGVLGLGLVNATIWDAALFFSLPESLTLRAGLLFLANGILFWVLVKLLPGIEVQGLLPALIAPVVFTVTSVLIAMYAPMMDWSGLFELFLAAFDFLRDYFSQPNLKKTSDLFQQIAVV
jgi:uncharacterized membrane protein YvlD (DUF360 family)